VHGGWLIGNKITPYARYADCCDSSAQDYPHYCSVTLDVTCTCCVAKTAADHPINLGPSTLAGCAI